MSAEPDTNVTWADLCAAGPETGTAGVAGQQPSPFADPGAFGKPAKAPVRMPRWLRETAAKLGTPAVENDGGLRRWLWSEGEAGVVLSRITQTWQLVVFTPDASVTLRSALEPTDSQVRAAVALAGLGGAT
jgi:hypothetical protein